MQRICSSGSAVWPPLMWPITSVSASSTTSASMRPEPGIEGPPVWIVLWMPYLRAQATICFAVGAVLDAAEPDLAEKLHAGRGELLEILLDHAGLDHRRAGMDLHAAGRKASNAALREDRHRLDADDVPRPAGRMHLAGRDHRGDAAMQVGIDPAELVLPRRPVAGDGMDVAVDQAGREGGALGVDDRRRAARRRGPSRARSPRCGRRRRRGVSASRIGQARSPLSSRPMLRITSFVGPAGAWAMS